MDPWYIQCASELDFDSECALYVGRALSPVTRWGVQEGQVSLEVTRKIMCLDSCPDRKEWGHETLEKYWRKRTFPIPHRPGPGQREAASYPSETQLKPPECPDPLKEKSKLNCFFDQWARFHFREESQWTQWPIFPPNPFSLSVWSRGHSAREYIFQIFQKKRINLISRIVTLNFIKLIN